MAEGGFFRCKQGFTVVQNAIVKDNNISLGAKGLYLLIQAYITMPNARCNKKDFEKMCPEGRRRFENAWNELRDEGYIKQHRRLNGKNFFIEYELLDEPVLGPYTYYYNAKGEITGTEDGMYDDRDKVSSGGNIQSTQDIVAEIKGTQHLVETQNGTHLNGALLKGAQLNGSHQEGALINGADNNKPYDTKTVDKDSLIKTGDLNTDSYSINHSIEPEEYFWDEYTPEVKADMVERLKKNIGFVSRKEKERPEDFELFDSLVNVVIKFILNNHKGFYVKIAGKNRPYNEVMESFMKLKFEHINCARNKVRAIGMDKIVDFNAYCLPVLFRLSESPVAACKDTKKKDSWDLEMKQNYDFGELERLKGFGWN